MSTQIIRTGSAVRVIVQDDTSGGGGGTAPTVAIGATTTLAAGASATVTNSGTATAAIFNFGIPRGADGSGTGGSSAWSSITGKPTTLAGYGITDAQSLTGTVAWSRITSSPTTLAGYGITDAQPIDDDLTAIAALTTTTYGRSLLALANAAALRTTAGLGTLATQSGTFSGTSSGTNTGDQTSVTGNSGTTTKLATARTINGVAFDGTANITIPTGAAITDLSQAVNFTGAADAYIPARVAMTIAQGNAPLGTGTLVYAKSTAAAPSTFTTTTLPTALEAGAWLRVTASAVTGFVAADLYRSA